MSPFELLFDFIGPKPIASGETTATQKNLAAIAGSLSCLLLAAIWGVAVGTHADHLALDNGLRVPLLLTATALTALPLGLVVMKLTSSEARPSDLLFAYSAAAFASSLLLAMLAPIIAVYQLSSPWAGLYIAIGSAFVALAVGAAILVRVVKKLLPNGQRLALALPVFLLCVVGLGTLSQLASVMSPIFPNRTVFGQGIDSIVEMRSEGQR
jgi:hypothetical protein